MSYVIISPQNDCQNYRPTTPILHALFLMGISMGKWPDFEYHVRKWVRYDRSGYNSSHPSLGSPLMVWCIDLTSSGHIWSFPKIFLKTAKMTLIVTPVPLKTCPRICAESQLHLLRLLWRWYVIFAFVDSNVAWSFFSIWYFCDSKWQV